MTGTWPALIGLALLSACKGQPGAPVPAQSPSGLPAAAAEEWALTAPMVEGYLRYQRTLLVQAGKLQGPAWDGGLKQFEEPTVERKADLDERARLEAGLTVDDVLKIEAMLSRVSAQRLTYRMMRMDEPVPDPGPVDSEDPNLGAELARAREDRARQSKSLGELREERQTFGSRNIDVLLQREGELLKNWGLLMEGPR